MMTAEENKRRTLQNNIWISVLLLVTIIGIGGAIYYYSESIRAKDRLKQANREIIGKNEALTKTRDSLRQRNLELKKIKDSLDNIVDEALTPTYSSIRLKPIIVARDSARAFARMGYARLKEKDFVAARNAFDKSEKFFNGYRDSYEVYFLLWQNRNRLNDPGVQKQVLDKIYKDYNSLRILAKRDIR